MFYRNNISMKVNRLFTPGSMITRNVYSTPFSKMFPHLSSTFVFSYGLRAGIFPEATSASFPSLKYAILRSVVFDGT